MSILENIVMSTTSAPRITIYGKPGIGKSTLASTFPTPLFILTENNGVDNVPVLPVAENLGELWENIKALLAIENFPFETIVIDSISKLDALIIERILESEAAPKNGAKSATLASACGGYGAGYLRAQQYHRAFKRMMDGFKEKGVAVIYIGHLAQTTIKPPDNEDHTIYTIVMNHDKSREVYIDDVDAVFMCHKQEFITESDSGRNLIKGGNQRIICTGFDSAHVSKNRFAMPKEIDMSFEAIKQYIPFYNEENK